ncbi:MAG: formylmethanofuran dehydrogenase [Gammaproteobacteria bacterium]|nr:MAG: formylmethanofuran dehydrogenase [Gammaproteobacteria bacterium]
MTDTLLLIPVRSNKQGTSLNVGKLEPEYQQVTSTVELDPQDMERLGLEAGNQIRLRARSGAEVVVTCQPRKAKDPSPGLMFIPYGPASSQLMEADTAATGMALSKHLEVQVEGPL